MTRGLKEGSVSKNSTEIKPHLLLFDYRLYGKLSWEDGFTKKELRRKLLQEFFENDLRMEIIGISTMFLEDNDRFKHDQHK